MTEHGTCGRNGGNLSRSAKKKRGVCVAKKIYKISAEGKEILSSTCISFPKRPLSNKKTKLCTKICTIQNKVVTLRAEIKENG